MPHHYYVVDLNLISDLSLKSVCFLLYPKCECIVTHKVKVIAGVEWHARLCSLMSFLRLQEVWQVNVQAVSDSRRPWTSARRPVQLGPPGTYPRKESSLGFVFLNFLLPLLPLWLNVQLSSFQHPSWSDEFPFPELRFPKEIPKTGFFEYPGVGDYFSCFINNLLHFRYHRMLSVTIKGNFCWTTFNT